MLRHGGCLVKDFRPGGGKHREHGAKRGGQEVGGQSGGTKVPEYPEAGPGAGHVAQLGAETDHV